MSTYRKSDSSMSTEERVAELEKLVDKYSIHENDANRKASVEKTYFSIGVIGIVVIAMGLTGASYYAIMRIMKL
jgi:hypothetical protein